MSDKTLGDIAAGAYFGYETTSGPIATEYWDRCAQAVADHVQKQFEETIRLLERDIKIKSESEQLLKSDAQILRDEIRRLEALLSPSATPQPRFKAGDVVYINRYGRLEKYIVCSVRDDVDEIAYSVGHSVDKGYGYAEEKQLLTQQQAIDWIKESK